MEPVAPLAAKPPVLAVIMLAPGLNVKEVLFVPVSIEVPRSIVEPLATVNMMAQVAVVPCDVMEEVGAMFTV